MYVRGTLFPEPWDLPDWIIGGPFSILQHSHEDSAFSMRAFFGLTLWMSWLKGDPLVADSRNRHM
jgi:hypothetical protein